MEICLSIYVFANILSQIRGDAYKSKTALHNIVFTNMMPENEEDNVHSEYYFGKCYTKHKELVAFVTKTYEDVESQLILRGWLKVEMEPRCVYVRARSPYGDLVRYHAFKFNFCICAITYNYMNNTTIFYYYEWYIPVEMRRGIDWDIFFYK